MLKTLKIKNVALTKEATIEFDEKLNIISGETGAGKSVLLDAIGLILGHKADKTLIKSGEEFLKVEATFNIFDNKKVEQFFLENDLEFDNCIIISRKVSQDGKNEVKLNGESVPLAYIKTLGKLLVDVHGQNDNNQILDRQNQLLLIDKFIDFDFNALKENYKKIVEINKKIKELSFDDDTRTRELDLLSYQISEIENANITVSKTVAGAMGDKTKDFTFQLKMTGNTLAELPYTKGEETGTLTVVDGVAEFTLSHGENIVLSEIPIGTTYEITEVDGASGGYTVESTNASGTLTEDTNVSFTNTRNSTVPALAHTNILISTGLFAIALAGLFWYLRKRKQ